MASLELPVAMVEILDERDASDGWSFDAQVLDPSGDLSRVRMRLSWADYNLWSPTGADTPASVARAVIQFLASHSTLIDLGASFDASIARRRFGDADERIPRLI